MDELNRRGVLQRTAGLGLIAALALEGEAGAQDKGRDEERKLDRACVLASGLTEAEADCWELAGELAGKLLALPELHPMDGQEIAQTIHVIQYRLLSRPTYRKYKEAHKKTPEKK
jgi:hypothetical protein